MSGTATTPATAPKAPLRVRLLTTPVEVRRPDGSLVHQTEWRTRKTADLLVLLSLHAGTHVPVPRLLECLWPGVDDAKGRASLRTAASTLRKVLGVDCIERGLNGLALTGALVDADELAEMGGRVRDAVAAGDLSEAVALGDSACRVYASDLAPFDADADWVPAERERLRRMFADLLGEAAEAAVSAGLLRSAVAFSQRLLEINPFDERAYRCTMLAYAGLGELENAVAAYVRCRSFLAEELGLDPAPQTREAYLAVLRAGQADAGTGVPAAPAESRPAELDSRLRKAADCFARRDLRQGDAEIKAARRGTMNAQFRAAMNVVVAEHAVLLGDAAKVVEMLAAAHEALEADPAVLVLPSGLDVEPLLALAQHDLGSRWISTGQLAAATRAERLPAWLLLRMLVERGDVADAALLAAEIRPAADSALDGGGTASVLEAMARAQVREATGDADGASQLLHTALDMALRSEAALLLPEIAGRLAMLAAPYDAGAAAAHLDLAEEMLGSGVFPRERIVTVLARCAIRSANGRFEAAAAGAALAAQIAEDTGLVHLAAEARACRQQYAPAVVAVPQQRAQPPVGHRTAIEQAYSPSQGA